MATIIPKLTVDRPLKQLHAQLMWGIEDCNEMIELESDEIDYRAKRKEMCQQLGIIEEVSTLRWAVDCDCFYTGKDCQ